MNKDLMSERSGFGGTDSEMSAGQFYKNEENNNNQAYARDTMSELFDN